MLLFLLRLVLPKDSRAYHHVFGRTESGQRLIDRTMWFAVVFFAFILALMAVEAINNYWKVIVGEVRVGLFFLVFPVCIMVILYWLMKFTRLAWGREGNK